MDRGTRLRLGLLTGLVVVGLGLGYAGTIASDEPAKLPADGVLFPPDKAVLLTGSFDVICNGEEATLQVNGKSYQWEPFQPPLHVARIRLSPGVYEFRIGDRQREIAVALNEDEHDGPQDWAIHRYHKTERDPNRCDDCHRTKNEDGQITVGEVKSYQACFDCHDSIEFGVIHSHPVEPIQHCQMCHSLHDSTRKGLLKAPAKKLCAECHDA